MSDANVIGINTLLCQLALPTGNLQEPSKINIIMKNITRITALGLLSVFLTAAALPAQIIVTGVKPVKVTKPIVFEQEVGKTITVRVAIDKNGIPQSVEAQNVDIYDKALAARVTKAVYEWEFTPAKNEYGNPVLATIELPVRITDIEKV